MSDKKEGERRFLLSLITYHSSLLGLSFEDSAEAVGGAVGVAARAAGAVCDYADAARFAPVVAVVVAYDGSVVLVVAGRALSAALYLFVARALLAALRRRRRFSILRSVAAFGDGARVVRIRVFVSRGVRVVVFGVGLGRCGRRRLRCRGHARPAALRFGGGLCRRLRRGRFGLLLPRRGRVGALVLLIEIKPGDAQHTSRERRDEHERRDEGAAGRSAQARVERRRRRDGRRSGRVANLFERHDGAREHCLFVVEARRDHRLLAFVVGECVFRLFHHRPTKLARVSPRAAARGERTRRHAGRSPDTRLMRSNLPLLPRRKVTKRLRRKYVLRTEGRAGFSTRRHRGTAQY